MNRITLDNRFEKTAKKIEDFSNLSTGWHYGQGIPPSIKVIARAKKLNEIASSVGFNDTNAFPGIDGEVQFTAYFEDLYLEFTIATDGLVTYVYERDHQEMEYETISYYEALAKIRSFSGVIWALSELLVKSTTIQGKNDFKVLPSNHRAQMGVYQSSIKIAPSKRVETSARTYESFTPKWQETRQYFGKSMPMSFHPILP